MSALEELREIPEYLKHENPDVRAQALTILKGFSVEEEHVKFLQSLNIIKPVIRLVADKHQVSSAALTLLVNLSAVDEIRTELVEGGVISVCMDYLMSAVNVRSPRLALMVLNNMTLDSTGAIDLMQEGKSFQGLHACRLFRWFNDMKLASDEADEWAQAGHILSNLSQLESFRLLAIDKKRGFLLSLKSQITSASVDRTTSALRIIHNIAYDFDKQFALLNPDDGVWVSVMNPIISYNANGSLDARELSNIDPSLQVLLASPIKTYHAVPSVRRLVLDIINVLCRNQPARLFLRASNTYQLLREVHNFERETDNTETDDFIEDQLIPYFILDEDALEGEPSMVRIKTLLQLERLSHGLSIDEEEEEEQGATEAHPMAQLAPDEDGEIEDANVYNNRMKQLHETEEKAMDERAKTVGKSMYTAKEGSFDPLSQL